jgi:hypothetical protein
MINPSDPALPWSGNLEAWQQMFSAMGQLPANWSKLSGSLDPQELDRRIAELRTVENWLKLNLGMLQSSIHGLEVQRATLAALRSFGSVPNAGAASPWWESARAAREPDSTSAQEPPAARPTPQPAAAPPSPPGSDATARGQAQTALNDAAQAWWTGLTRQFEQLAQTAQANMAAPSPLAAMPAMPPKPAATGRTRPPTPAKSASPGKKPAAKPARKAAARPSGQKTASPRSRNA